MSSSVVWEIKPCHSATSKLEHKLEEDELNEKESFSLAFLTNLGYV